MQFTLRNLVVSAMAWSAVSGLVLAEHGQAPASGRAAVAPQATVEPHAGVYRYTVGGEMGGEFFLLTADTKWDGEKKVSPDFVMNHFWKDTELCGDKYRVGHETHYPELGLKVSAVRGGVAVTNEAFGIHREAELAGDKLKTPAEIRSVHEVAVLLEKLAPVLAREGIAVQMTFVSQCLKNGYSDTQIEFLRKAAKRPEGLAAHMKQKGWTRLRLSNDLNSGLTERSGRLEMGAGPLPLHWVADQGP